ncbi:MAG TPA: Ig-like domain-containing protein, partial [Vicinamibacterales bacterium]|nr:Ig-like domain-containing protein [Vicinamibacterales bacterium]
MRFGRGIRRLPVIALTLLAAATAGNALGVQAQAQAPSVRIAEIHYDNGGTDAGEAIEISAPAGTNLTGWQIVLYNAASTTASVYDTKTLSGVVAASCGARGVVVQTYPSNGIQNGSPDGIALVNPNGAVVEFLSYEGTFTGMGGPAAGILSTDIGVTEAGTESLGLSLQRTPAGTWTGPVTSTFGSCNDEDPGPPAEVASITVTPSSATIVENTTRTFAAAAFDAEGGAINGVPLTWTSSNLSVATVSAAGVATGVSVGQVTITAAAANGVQGTATLQVDAEPPPTGPSSTYFSEIHYDNFGTDFNEAIEIEGPAGTDLTGWSVVLYNGNDGRAYNTRSLSGAIPASCDGRGVAVLLYPENGLQNGAPDAMALIDADGRVLEFISYEGTFTAIDGPAAGRPAIDILAAQNSAPIGQ